MTSMSFLKSDKIPLEDHMENYNSIVRDVVDTYAPLLRWYRTSVDINVD